MELNFNNTSLNDSGSIRFSGISSGIDFQSSINAIIEAKRQPAVQIETKISLNDSKAAALNDLKELSASFASTLETLRGSSSFFSTDVFDSKVSFLDSQATAGAPAGHTPSAAAALLGVTVDDKAVPGSYAVEVVQTARAQQLRTDAFSSKTADLTTLGYTAGDFDINGRTVTLSAGDSLLDLRDKINAANTGLNPTNVSATVVSVSDTESYLVLTSTESGLDNQITFGGTQAVHNGLGLTVAGTDTVKTETVAAQNSIIRVDNLGVDIERQSNVISDVIPGVTINLFKAEANTEVKIDVEEDLNTIKTSVVEFVEAYNALRDFVSDQKSEVVREEGGDPEFGVLAFDSTLRQVASKMNELVSTSVPGAADGYASLSQVGITMNEGFKLEIDDETFDQRILSDVDALKKLFAFDFSSSDSRVIAVNREATTQIQVDANGDPLPYYLNVGGTDADGSVISANIADTAGTGTGGAFDGTVSVSGSSIVVGEASGAEGLTVLFNGGANAAPVDDIEVVFTRGVADQLFSYFNDLSRVGGRLDTEVTNLLQQNEDYQEDIDRIDSRLEIQRETLTAKFVAAEQAMLQLENLKDSLTQTFEAMNGGN